MIWKSLDPRARLRRAAGVVLAAGLLAAGILYLTVPPEAEDPLGDVSESKPYLHDLELYGGKANVLQDEFRRWFDGLWHGKQLAGTVAFLSVATAAVLRMLAAHVHAPAPARPDTAPGGPASNPGSAPLRLVPPRESRRENDDEGSRPKPES